MIFPDATKLIISNALAPIEDRVVLSSCTFPDATFGFDYPVDLARFSLLHDYPIRMVESDRPAGLEVVHPELRAGLALLRGAERGETQHIGCRLVEELREGAGFCAS